MLPLTTILCLVLFTFLTTIQASPRSLADRALPGGKRTPDPVFPPRPPSCPICAKDYPNINSCAKACPVFANFTMIIFNPGAFVDVIKCACVDTFQAAYPQCVDCFLQTNQSAVLEGKDLPAIVDGMRKICAIKSTLLGNVANNTGQVTLTSIPPGGARPTSTNGVGSITLSYITIGLMLTSLMGMGIVVI